MSVREQRSITSDGFILALDCQYDDTNDLAGVAGVLLECWSAPEPAERYSYTHKGLEPYVSGQFYKRELPCLLPLIQRVMDKIELSIIVVDGFVDLAEKRAGLGRHLYNSLNKEITIVGVAKNRFEGASAQAIYRGISRQPLWVSSTNANEHYDDQIISMHGEHRIPTVLKVVDRMAREICAG